MRNIWIIFILINTVIPTVFGESFQFLPWSDNAIMLIAFFVVVLLAAANGFFAGRFAQLRWTAAVVGVVNVAGLFLLGELSFVTAAPSALSLIF